MKLFSLHIPQIFIYAFFFFWTVGFFYLGKKKNFFTIQSQSAGFPFTVRRFFLMGVSVACAFGIYFASSLLAMEIVRMIQQSQTFSFTHEAFKNHTVPLCQIIGLIIASIGLLFFGTLLPDDVRTLVVGSNYGWKSLGKGILAGLVIYPVIISTSFCFGHFVDFLHLGPRSPQVAVLLFDMVKNCPSLFFSLIAVVVFSAPFVEEMVFRGYIQGFLLGVIHPFLALSLTAFFFATLHYAASQLGSNIEIMVSLFFFSIYTSILRLKMDSIVTAIGAHATFNAINVLVYL